MCEHPDGMNTVDRNGDPYDPTVGYDLSGAVGHSLGAATMHISGITCARGYNGTVNPTPCPWDALTSLHPTNSPYYYALSGCSADSCTAAQVADSSHVRTESIRGVTSDVVDVVCDTEHEGGGSWTCQPDGLFNGLSCTPVCHQALPCCGRGDMNLSSSACACDIGRSGASCEAFKPYGHRRPNYASYPEFGDWSQHSMTIVLDGRWFSTREFLDDISAIVGVAARYFTVFDVTYHDTTGHKLEEQVRVHFGAARVSASEALSLYVPLRDSLMSGCRSGSGASCVTHLAGLTVVASNLRVPGGQSDSVCQPTA